MGWKDDALVVDEAPRRPAWEADAIVEPAPTAPAAALAPPAYPPGRSYLTAQETAERYGTILPATEPPPLAPQAQVPAGQTLASVGRKYVGGVQRGSVETLGAILGSIARTSPSMQAPVWSDEEAERAGLMATGGRGMPRSPTEAARREAAYSDAELLSRQHKRNYFDNAMAEAAKAGKIAFEAEKVIETLPPEHPVEGMARAAGRAARRVVSGPALPPKELVEREKQRAATSADWIKKWYAAGQPPMEEWLRSPEIAAMLAPEVAAGVVAREATSFDDWLAAGAPEDVAAWYNSPQAKAAREVRQGAAGYQPTWRLKTRGVATAEEINKGIQRLIAEHPDWQTPQVNTARELLANPEALAGNLGAMLPYMAATTAAILVGSPQLAFMVGVAVEGDQAYQQAKADMQGEIQRLLAAGKMQEAATLQSNMEGNAAVSAAIVGTANAIVEQAQISGMIKVGNPAARTMLARNLSRLAKAKIAGGMIAKQAFEEGLEEVIQGATQDLTAGVIYQKKIDPEQFWNQRQIEGLLGALAYGPGGVASTGFHYLTQPREAVPAPQAAPAPVQAPGTPVSPLQQAVEAQAAPGPLQQAVEQAADPAELAARKAAAEMRQQGWEQPARVEEVAGTPEARAKAAAEAARGTADTAEINRMIDRVGDLGEETGALKSKPFQEANAELLQKAARAVEAGDLAAARQVFGEIEDKINDWNRVKQIQRAKDARAQAKKLRAAGKYAEAAQADTAADEIEQAQEAAPARQVAPGREIAPAEAPAPVPAAERPAEAPPVKPAAEPAPAQEKPHAEAIPSPEAEVRVREGREDVRRQRQDRRREVREGEVAEAQVAEAAPAPTVAEPAAVEPAPQAAREGKQPSATELWRERDAAKEELDSLKAQRIDEGDSPELSAKIEAAKRRFDASLAAMRAARGDMHIGEGKYKPDWQLTKLQWELKQIAQRRVDEQETERLEKRLTEEGRSTKILRDIEDAEETGTHRDIIRNRQEMFGDVPAHVLRDYASEPWAAEALAKMEKAVQPAAREAAKPAPIQPEAEAGPVEPGSLPLENIPIVNIPVSQLELSKDVPQFKMGASRETGVVPGEELGGAYQRFPSRPITVWKRKDGRLEVITGRHRLDLARRTGERTIPAQIVKESDGFNQSDALALDAESNILDGKGTVADYARYFRNADITEEAARDRGLLAGSRGRDGWTIAKAASEDLYSRFASGAISQEKAVAIARGAPGDEATQLAVVQKADSLTADELHANARILARVRDQGAPQKATQGGLFGFDDSAIQQAEAVARQVGRELKDLRRDLGFLRHADQLRKKPALAEKYGIDINDPQSIENKRAELEARVEELSHVDTSPALYQEMLTKAGRTEAPLFSEQAQPPPAEEAKGPFADNKVFTQEQVDAADEVINKAREAARKRPHTRRGGFAAIPDAEVLKAYVVKGLAEAERIIRKLGKLAKGAWVKAMRQENPELEPRDLKRIWGLMRRENLGRLVEIEKAVRKAATAAARPSAVKAQVAGITKPAQPTIPMTARQLLRTVMRKLEVTAPKIYLAAARDTVRMHKDLAQWATKQLEGELVTQPERDRLLAMLAGARTPGEKRDVVAAITILRDRAEHRKAAEDFRQAVKDLDFRHLRSENQAKARPILDAFQLKARGETVMNGLRKLIAASELDPENLTLRDLANHAQERLARYQHVPLSKWDAESLRAATRVLQAIAAQNRLKNALLVGKQYRTVQEAAEEVADTLRKNFGQPPAPGAPPGMIEPQKPAGIISRYAQESDKPETLILGLSGGNEDSASYKLAWEAVGHVGYGDKLRLYQDGADAIRPALDAAGLTGDRAEVRRWSEAATEPGRIRRFLRELVGRGLKTRDVPVRDARVGDKMVPTLRMSADDLMSFYARTARASTRRLHENGVPMTLAAYPTSPVYMTAETVADIRNSLSAEEKAIVEAALAFLNGPGREQLNIVHEDINGFPLLRDMPTPEDQYWPRAHEREYEDATAKGMMKWYRGTLEDLGFLKPAPGTEKPIANGSFFGTYMHHLNQVSSYVGLAKPLQQARMVLDDPAVKIAARDVGQQGRLGRIKDALSDIEGMGSDKPNVGMRIFNAFKPRFYSSVMNLNVFGAAKQVVSYISARNDMPVDAWRHGLPGIARPHGLSPLKIGYDEATETEMREWSSILRAREEGTKLGLMGPVVEGAGLQRFILGSMPARFGMGMYQRGDSRAMQAIWRGWKWHGENVEGLTGDALMEYAAFQAERTIYRTQSNWDIPYQSALGRRAATEGIAAGVTMFTSETNAWWQNARRAMMSKDWRKILTFAGTLFVNALVVSGIDELRRWIYSGFGKTPRRNTPLVSFAYTMLANMTAIFYGSDKLVVLGEAMQGRTEFERFPDRTPGADFLNDMADTVAHGVNAGQEAWTGEVITEGPKKGEPKAEQTVRRMVLPLLKTVATMTGMPKAPIYWGQAYLRAIADVDGPPVLEVRERFKRLDKQRKQWAAKKERMPAEESARYYRLKAAVDRIDSLRKLRARTKDVNEQIRIKVREADVANAALAAEK